MFLIFDTETTGRPDNYNAPISDSENWPRMVQISWQLHDALGQLMEVKNYIIAPEGYEIPYGTVKIHGITTERAQRQGVDLLWVLQEFNKALQQATYVVGHNVDFDLNITGAEYYRKELDTTLMDLANIDTMQISTDYCAIPGGRGGKFKWPKLGELHHKLFGEKFDMAHNAAADVEATARAFFELLRLQVVSTADVGFTHQQWLAYVQANPITVQPIGLNTQPYDPNDLEAEPADALPLAADTLPSSAQDKLETITETPEEAVSKHDDYEVDTETSAPLDNEPAKAVEQEDEEGVVAHLEEKEEAEEAPVDKKEEDAISSAADAPPSPTVEQTAPPEEQVLPPAKDEGAAGVPEDTPAEESAQAVAEADVAPKSPPAARERFVHLHLHTHFSILDGATKVDALIEHAKATGIRSIAITDHGNMFGVKEFYNLAKKEGIKPIIGCEVYVARRGMARKETKLDGGGWHLVLLAKNKQGYRNLMKLVSFSWLDGMYYKPRVDHELLSQYSEGLIALSACLGGEINQKLMNVGREAAVEAALWYKNLFGKDYYLELQRHQTGDVERDKKVYEDQVFVNAELIKIAKEHDIPLVATNDVHFLHKEHSVAHDHLICINTNKYYTDKDRMRYTGQEWLKTADEMISLFADVPEAIENTVNIAEQIELYELNSAPIMPHFEIPEPFEDDNAYLHHLVYEGAHWRWGQDLSEEVIERLDFELATIKEMGYPSYFLIVWDFIKAARDMDVEVGPGRGSAAGSAVAYTLKITDIDPFEYDLLFERFLNPDRVSLPDIDIDFEDEGRGKVLEWVVNKYGTKRVAHIITMGSLAAKSSIRDVGRVQQFPLKDTMELQKMVPDKPGTTLAKAYKEVQSLQMIRQEDSVAGRVLQLAETLEGTNRNTGVHACGIIIGRDDLENYVPVSTARNSELTYVTQYDGRHVEHIGLLKMDFLGLKTLGVIKQAIRNVKSARNIDIDFDKIGFDDPKTYELFVRGDTTGIFQFESDGMKKHLRDLKPSVIGDLIAMTALYRPGPMEYIPSYVSRKHGKEKVEYDVPMMADILADTYGITVYQEQIMLLSRKLAGFTRGQSDSLRKAMGKKDKDLMAKLKEQFFIGCEANAEFMEACKAKNVKPRNMMDTIWGKWQEFAKYAFNKSHAAAYTFLSYRTAYLKANYPAEFMASVLSNNMNSIDDVTHNLDDCKHLNIDVLGPDVNESGSDFTVNKEGKIRFGLNAIKGVGSAAAADLIAERSAKGPFTSTFDLLQRVNLRSVNKKSLESMAYAGAFDSLGDVPRHVFFYRKSENDSNFLEKLIQYGHKYQSEQNSAQMSLFGDLGEVSLPNPDVPEAPKWSALEKLMNEKEVVGFYLSGHPLDDYKFETLRMTNISIAALTKDKAKYRNKSMVFLGLVSEPMLPNIFDRNGNPYGRFTVEDLTGKIDLFMKGEQYDRYKHMVSSQHRLVRIKVGLRSYKKEKDAPVYIDVQSVEPLNDLLERRATRIDMQLNLADINPALTKELRDLANACPGVTPLSVHVIDKETEQMLYLVPQTIKVNAKSFSAGLEAMPNVVFDIKIRNH